MRGNEFLDKMAPVIPDGISGEYVCVNFNEEYRRYIDEKYGVARYVQFVEGIDCFYDDDQIIPFIYSSYVALTR